MRVARVLAARVSSAWRSLLGLLLQGFDCGNGVEGLEALVEAGDLLRDDGFGLFSFAAAVGEVGLGDLLEVVDVIDETSVDFVQAGVDVAGDGDIDEEHGPAAAALR